MWQESDSSNQWERSVKDLRTILAEEAESG